MEVMNGSRPTEYINGLHRIDALPPHMARVQVRPDDLTRRFAQTKQGCRGMNGKSAMKLKTDFYVMVSRIFSPLGPIWNHFIFPLPGQDFLKIIRPRGDRPVRIFRILMIARAAGKCIDNRYFQQLCQLNCFNISIVKFLCNRFLRVKRVAMAAKCTNDQTARFYSLLKFIPRCFIFQ
ncbi:hypothetical protein D3C80_1335460 [compost metagenome]